MQTRDAVEGLHNFWGFFQPPGWAFKSGENLPALAAQEYGWEVESLIVLCGILRSRCEEKMLTDIIANVKVVLYAENFLEKITSYEKISKPKGGNRSAVR